MPRTRLLALALLTALPLRSAPAALRGQGEEPADRWERSHARMLGELERMRARADVENGYTGTGRARRARAALEALPEDAPVQQRISLLLRLGHAELGIGAEREGIAALARAHELLPRLGARLDPEFGAHVAYRLAVAWMRRAETENCCGRWTADSCIFPIGGQGVHADKAPARTAVRYLEEVLATPDLNLRRRLAAVWLLNIAHQTLGDWPDGVPEEHRLPPEAFASDVELPRLRNVAPALGLDTESLAGGAVADDFDGDGRVDLVVSTWNPAGQLRYWHNRGDGGFEERTAAANLTGITGGLNLVHGDYDGDGDLDLLVLRGAWLGRQGKLPNSLLRNDGGGRFLDVTFAAGLGAEHFPTQTAAFADFDGDGDLDLYVGNESAEGAPAPCQLFRNEGDGTFVDVARAAGVTNDRFAKAVSWGDYDGDGRPDLYVSNGRGYAGDELAAPSGAEGRDHNRLYRNRGDGTFEDVAPRLGVVEPRGGFTAWFWDFDNDGVLDILAAAYVADLPNLAAWHLGMGGMADTLRLYRGDGEGGFDEVAAAAGLGEPCAPMGANFGDLDGDGRLDLYLGTGYPDYQALMPNKLYLGRPGGFADATTAAGVGHLQKGHAVVFADFDDDGDLDLFEELGGALLGDRYRDALWENPGFGNRWLAVELRGVRSNRFGVGARLRVVVEVGGATGSAYRHVNSGGTFGGNPLRQTIGLGAAERIARLEVLWPTTGATQVFEDVPLDRCVRVVEGEDELEVLALPPLDLAGPEDAGGER